jgi:lysine 2,3-aminomutase
MAGSSKGNFRELISPFLREKISKLTTRYGENDLRTKAIINQYVKSPLEDIIHPSERLRHYESEINIDFDGAPLIGVERLYRRTVLIEPTTACAAHCRWCLRGQYPIKTMQYDDIERAARYIGSSNLRDDVNEVLITGGDPLLSTSHLNHTLAMLTKHADNVKIIRMGTRVPFQDPYRINDNMLAIFNRYRHFRFELGLNINHPIEFWPECILAIKKLKEIGMVFYNQHPLLKNVNDDFKTLVELYDYLRQHGIEAHYLFHAIPMRGMGHHRTSLHKGLSLISEISACGEFSGRSKPRFAVLSDIGKIVLYHGTILDVRVKERLVLLKSYFKLEDRLKWNPSWKQPSSVMIDSDGTLLTWYLDGSDDRLNDQTTLYQDVNLHLDVELEHDGSPKEKSNFDL